MEFNTLLEHFGRSGYDITNNINVFMNSKKQVVLRFINKSSDQTWPLLEQTKYKFKTPSTLSDITEIINVSNSIKSCTDCGLIFSTIENKSCPTCLMKDILKRANALLVNDIDCSLCGNKCINGLYGNNGKTILTCGHHMCNGCFFNIKKSGQKFVCTDDTINTIVNCPFCRSKENVTYK